MVIGDLDIVGVAVFPKEAYPPLIVDPDAPLACSVAGKLLQPIARWDTQEVESGCAAQLLKFALRNTLNVLRQPG